MSRITGIELRLVSLPLVRPFRTSFGEETAKECILASVQTEDVGIVGEGRLRLQGRLPDAEPRGGALALAELLGEPA